MVRVRKVTRKNLFSEPMKFKVFLEPTEEEEEIPRCITACYNSITGELWFEQDGFEIDSFKKEVRRRVEGIVKRYFNE